MSRLFSVNEQVTLISDTIITPWGHKNKAVGGEIPTVLLTQSLSAVLNA